jgi:hypothetical protein
LHEAEEATAAKAKVQEIKDLQDELQEHEEELQEHEIELAN